MLRPTIHLLLLIAFSLTWFSLTHGVRGEGPDEATGFTPLTPLATPKIIRCAEEYPGRSFAVGHIVDDRPESEYASHGQGTDTFIDFDFGRPVAIAGFQHVDRRDPATVDEAELVFSDRPDFTLGDGAGNGRS